MSVQKPNKVRKDTPKETLPNLTPDHPDEDRTAEPGGLYTDAEHTGDAQRPTPGTAKDETPPNRADKIG